MAGPTTAKQQPQTAATPPPAAASATTATHNHSSSHNSNNNTSSSRQKKSKLEKIYELAANLKIVKEENRKLRKEIHELRHCQASSSLSSYGAGSYLQTPSDHSKKTASTTPSSATTFSSSCGGTLATATTVSTRSSSCTSSMLLSSVPVIDAEEFEKMNLALQAMTRVTCNQERTLNSLRRKAKLRRDELKLKDATIASLRRQVQSLETALRATDEGELRIKLSKAQCALFSKRRECANLKQELEACRTQQPGKGDQAEDVKGVCSDDDDDHHAPQRKEQREAENEVDHQNVCEEYDNNNDDTAPAPKSPPLRRRRSISVRRCGDNNRRGRSRVTTRNRSESSKEELVFNEQDDIDDDDAADDQRDKVKALQDELEQSTHLVVALSMELEQMKVQGEKRGTIDFFQQQQQQTEQDDHILSPLQNDDNDVEDDLMFDGFDAFSPIKFPRRVVDRTISTGGGSGSGSGPAVCPIDWGDDDDGDDGLNFPSEFG